MKRKKLLAILTTILFLSLIAALTSRTYHKNIDVSTKSKVILPPLSQTSASLKILYIESDIGGGKVEINRDVYELPVKLRVPNGTVIIIRPQPVGLYEPLSTEINLTILDDTIVKIKYRRKYVLLTLNAEAPLLLNGTRLYGKATLKIPINSTINLNSTCDYLDDYTLMCSTTVIIPRENLVEYYPINVSLRLENDTHIIVRGHRLYILRFNFPVGAWVNGSYRQGFFELRPVENSTLEIGLYNSGNTATGCIDYNSTHYLCIRGWITPPWISNSTLPPIALKLRVISGGEFSESLEYVLKRKFSSDTIIICEKCGGFKRVEDPFMDYRKVFGLADRYNITTSNGCLQISTDSIARLLVILPKTSGHITLRMTTTTWHNNIGLVYLNGKPYDRVPSFTLQGGTYIITVNLDNLKEYFEGKTYNATRVIVSGLDFIEYSYSLNILTKELRVLPNTGEFALDIYLQGDSLSLCLIGD